jgi:hypothetical protein
MERSFGELGGIPLFDRAQLSFEGWSLCEMLD